jgi:hypothetical protein
MRRHAPAGANVIISKNDLTHSYKPKLNYLTVHSIVTLPSVHQLVTKNPMNKMFGSIPHSKRRTILWPRFASVVKPRSGDVGMAEPFLDLGDVGLVREGIRGRRSAQGVHT